MVKENLCYLDVFWVKIMMIEVMRAMKGAKQKSLVKRFSQNRNRKSGDAGIIQDIII